MYDDIPVNMLIIMFYIFVLILVVNGCGMPAKIVIDQLVQKLVLQKVALLIIPFSGKCKCNMNKI